MYVQTKPYLQINTLGRCLHGENNMVRWLGAMAPEEEWLGLNPSSTSNEQRSLRESFHLTRPQFPHL